MRTLICRTCGCSLVRLGVSYENANTHRYGGKNIISAAKGALTCSSRIPRHTSTKRVV